MLEFTTHLMALLLGLSLAFGASKARGDELTDAIPKLDPPPAFAPPQKCPDLDGRYTCKSPFMLSSLLKTRGAGRVQVKNELKVVQSEQDGYSLFLFEASDGARGFYAVGDGTPHAYDSELKQAWGFKDIDTEAHCRRPESLEIQYHIGPGRKNPMPLHGVLSFVQKDPKTLFVTARAFPTGNPKHPKVQTTTCQRIDD